MKPANSNDSSFQVGSRILNNFQPVQITFPHFLSIKTHTNQLASTLTDIFVSR